MSRQPTIVYSADNVQQAYLLRSLLEDEGIAAQVVNDAIQIAGGDLPVGWTAAAKVVVPDDEAEQAREFVAQFDQQTRRRSRSVESEDDSTAEPVLWQDWPHCPDCLQSRSARCPTCRASGIDFPLADLPDTDDGEPPLLHCPSCDDTFRPQWYRLCARCGHDFGNGLEIQQKGSGSLDFSPRSIAVAGALLFLAMTALAYFFWLFGARGAVPTP